MKKTFLFASALFALLFSACEDNFPERTSGTTEFTAPSAAEFTAMRTAAYNNLKQEFSFDAGDTYTFTSEKGVEVTIYGGCLTKNGAPVTGEVDVEFVELFDRGTMLVNNKPTMGITGGDMSLLISGGEFYLNVTQDGVALETNCGYMLSAPVNLTGGEDNEMTSFTGTVNSNGQVVWSQTEGEFWIGSNQSGEGESYYNAFIQAFGWFNCDKFAGFTGPMTDIEVIVPEGYNNQNSQIFIAIEGEPNTLGNLFGEYPVGLECYIIFVSADADGNWVYAIKPVTLTENASYTFTEAEFNTATEAQVIAAINALP